MFEVRVVCEGPTDVVVLQAILDDRLKEDYVITQLQPEGSLYGGDAGPHGGGWKGVRGWCRKVGAAGGLEAVGALNPDVQLLVVHVDADIASDSEIDIERPCPPPMATVERLESVVLGWLGLAALPARVALCIPSKATESWILRAFFPTDEAAVPCSQVASGESCIECIAEPAHTLLYRRPKFVRLKEGRIRKLRKEYERRRSQLSRAWLDVVADCASAARFNEQLDAVLR